MDFTKKETYANICKGDKDIKEQPKKDDKIDPDLITKEIYLHFKNYYDKHNWMFSYPSWEDITDGDKKLWSSIVQLSYDKINKLVE